MLRPAGGARGAGADSSSGHLVGSRLCISVSAEAGMAAVQLGTLAEAPWKASGS